MENSTHHKKTKPRFYKVPRGAESVSINTVVFDIDINLTASNYLRIEGETITIHNHFTGALIKLNEKGYFERSKRYLDRKAEEALQAIIEKLEPIEPRFYSY